MGKHNWYYGKLTFKVFKERPGVDLEYNTGTEWYIVTIDPTPGKDNKSIIQWSDDGEHWEDVNFNVALKIADKVLANKDNLKKIADIVANYKNYLRK